MGTLIILGMIAIIVVLFVILGLKTISQSETVIIERLGKYHSTLSAGINIIWPIIDKPRQIYCRYVNVDVDGNHIIISKLSNKIDLREQVYDFS